jgi:hypothetical protein
MCGAGEESRTLDLNLGKVALYQLSYSRIASLLVYTGILLWSVKLEKPARYFKTAHWIAKLHGVNAHAIVGVVRAA